MFDFIPLEHYTALYYHLLFVIMVLIFVYSLSSEINDISALNFTKVTGFFLLFFAIFYMGLRPISKQFGDMVAYAGAFKRLQFGENIKIKSDFLFNNFIKVSSQIMDAKLFFLLVAILYILPCYFFSKKYFKSYWFYVFFMFLSSFSFWSYGTNGIRNGLATALFVLALYFYERKILMYAIMTLAFGFHNSLMIPIAAFVISGIYKNPKIYLYIWLASIPLSLIGGSFWESFFAGFGFGNDTRAIDYLTKGNVNNDQFTYTGFRWDFILYSSFAVFAGWYFIFKKNITDKFYIHLWGTYMIANAFWILVIRANFSNRFAYLSWFLMAPVIAYPMFKYKLWNNQFRYVGVTISLYYLFSYILFFIS